MNPSLCTPTTIPLHPPPLTSKPILVAVRYKSPRPHLLTNNNSILQVRSAEVRIVCPQFDRSNTLLRTKITEDIAGARARHNESSVGTNWVSKVTKVCADADARAVGGDVGLDSRIGCVVGELDTDGAGLLEGGLVYGVRFGVNCGRGRR